MRRALLLFLCLLAGTGSWAWAARRPLTFTGFALGGASIVAAGPTSITFTGVVKDVRGRAVPGATVYATIPDSAYDPRATTWHPRVERTVAAGDGSFRLRAVIRRPVWAVSFAAAKAGHGPGGFPLYMPAPTTGLTLTLTRPAALTGTVRGPGGEPITGATVRVLYAQQPTYESMALPPEEARPVATTDGQGRFRLTGLPARSRVELEVRQPHYARLRARLSCGEQDAEIALEPAAAVEGRLVDDTGRPIAGAVIRCFAGHEPRTATTSADGSYRFTHLPAAGYMLSVQLTDQYPGRSSEPQGVIARGGQTARAPDLQLTRLPAETGVTGRVVTTDGRPIPDAWVTGRRQVALPGIFSTDWDGGMARTRPDGSYRLSLPPGNWRLSTFSTSPEFNSFWLRREEEPSVAVSSGRWGRAEFRLRPPVTVQVRVLDAAGRPAAGAVARRSYGDTRIADANGVLRVGRYPAGEQFQFSLFSRDGRQGAVLATVAGRQTAAPAVRLQPLPEIGGVVTDGNGRPIADAWVSAQRMVPTGGGMSGHFPEAVRSVSTDARGRFRMHLFPASAYRIEAGADGYAGTDRYPVRVGATVASNASNPLRLTLDRPDGAVSGIVVDPEGKPLAGAQVACWRSGATGVYLDNQERKSDAAGRFRFRRLPRGRVGLYAGMPGYLGERREGVLVGAAGVRLMIAPQEEARKSNSGPRVGEPAPEFRVARWVNGSAPSALHDLRGRTVLLQLTAPYNAAARAANARLTVLQSRLAAAGRDDVAILALVAEDVSAEEAAAYARSEGLPFPVGIAAPGEAAGDPFTAYGARQLPRLFVIDVAGVLRAVDPLPAELERLILRDTRGKEAPQP